MEFKKYPTIHFPVYGIISLKTDLFCFRKNVNAQSKISIYLFIYLPERSFVVFRFSEVGVLQLSPEQLLAGLHQAPGREEAIAGQRVNAGLVVGQLCNKS
jgi:hypothetical protein